MLLDDIYVMWIPVFVVALMAALGAWRGVYRELAVSAAIVLAALVAVQWATQRFWALDLSKVFTGLGAGEWQFFLTLILMSLIVAVMGYGLGGLIARRSSSRTNRVLGALVGMANGAALSGWVLRAAYEGLERGSGTSAVYQNPISQGMMIWAGWFPVALAVLGALAALVYSLRGDRAATVVETTRPTTAIAYPAAPARPVYVPHIPNVPPSPAASSQGQASQPYYAQPQHSDAYGTFAPALPAQSNPVNAESTILMPTREQSALAPTLANPMPAPPPARLAPDPSTQHSNSQSVSLVPPTEQSPSQAADPESRAENPKPKIETPPFGYDLSALWASEQESKDSTQQSGGDPAPSTPSSTVVIAPTNSGPTQPSPQAGGEATHTQAEQRCRSCGSLLPEEAMFCTECGARV